LPDWVHAVLYILIVTVSMFLVFNIDESIWAMIAGLIGGHFLAVAVIKRLPGFWGK